MTVGIVLPPRSQAGRMTPQPGPGVGALRPGSTAQPADVTSYLIMLGFCSAWCAPFGRKPIMMDWQVGTMIEMPTRTGKRIGTADVRSAC